MKINITGILIIALLSTARLIVAQPSLTDSSQVYNYWAQRGIIEMVYAHMNDYIETVGETESIVEIVSKKKYEVVFLKNINDSLPSLSEVSQFMKSNNWSGVEKNLFQPLISHFLDKQPLDTGFFEAKKPGSNQSITVITEKNNERVNWKKKENEILDGYEKDLANLAPPTSPSTENSFAFVDETKSLITTTEVLIILSIFVLGGFLGAWLVFYFSKCKIYSILKEERGYYLDYSPLKTEKSIFHYITLFHVLKRRKDSYKKLNHEIRKEMELLEAEKDQLKSNDKSI